MERMAKALKAKRIGCLMVGVLLSLLPGMAQENKKSTAGFMDEELRDFNKFMDDAEKDFIDFMRNPWKQFEAKKPVEKRVKPEPVKPVVFDEKSTPKDEKPVRLTIEEILDMTTDEGKQQPVIQVDDVDRIVFDDPVEVVKPSRKPTVTVVKKKPAKRPVVTVEGAGKEEKPVNTQPEKPVQPTQPAQPEKPEEPAQPNKPVQPEKPQRPAAQPAPSAPLFDGGDGRTRFVCGGTAYYLSNALNRKCRLSSLSENAIADAYESLGSADYRPLVADLQQVKTERLFNDWAVCMLVKQVAEAYCSNHNESIVMRQFLLNELGYKARMARKADGNKLVLYVATDCQVYGSIFITQNGLKYYDFDNKTPYDFYMCPKDSPKAKRTLSMQWGKSPMLAGERTTSIRQAKGSAARTSVSVSKSLMEFYKSYPQCDYGVYVKAGVDSEVEQALLSALSPLVAGKSEKDAANLLLNYVQTAFQYATDHEQFGYEKPFFLEELFYYPSCDCEDRSVLFGYLVKKLLHLDVVYLDYPDHIATAVCFRTDVGGDYLTVGGRKYTVCDPTYIGASIGMTMPMYKSVAAKVLRY